MVILMTSPIISPSPFFLAYITVFRGDFKSQSGQSADIGLAISIS
jgi:hypothetical protein